MSTPVQEPVPPMRPLSQLRLHLPTVPEALASLLRTVVAALFLLTFVLQPYLIPSESMEHTLLVGDFLLVNKQLYARPGILSRWLLPYLRFELRQERSDRRRLQRYRRRLRTARCCPLALPTGIRQGLRALHFHFDGLRRP